MKKFLIITGVVLVLIIGAQAYFRFFYTKSFSPESDVSFDADGLKIHIIIIVPSKKAG